MQSQDKSSDQSQDQPQNQAQSQPQDIMARPASPVISEQARALCDAFSRAVDMSDGHRDGHSRDASYYARLIASEYNLSDHEVDSIELAALMHGIGKLTLPDTLLHKSTPLTPAELGQVHDALISGASLVREVPGFETIAEIVCHQGERWDGTGSPDGLLHEEIPLGARILAVALRFAAMTRPRADRPALSVVGGALEFLAYEAGIALDPKVVRTFLGLMGREYSDEAM
jgi:HD-GYP domain-containing protein (c-di-GMP phosphodiesterase class II)